MLEPSLATATGKATHRFTTASPHFGEWPPRGVFGRSADPRRVVESRVTLSERTVSRYLPDRLTEPSQTWRTFLANHIGNLAFASTVTALFGESDDDGVDVCGLPCRPVLPSRDGRHASSQWAFVDWPPSLPPTSHAWRVAQDQLRRRTRTRFSSGKDPPQSWTVDTCAGGVRLEVRDVPRIHLDEGVHLGLRPSDSEGLRRQRHALGHSVRNHR
jgi:hypothetical protein